MKDEEVKASDNTEDKTKTMTGDSEDCNIESENEDANVGFAFTSYNYAPVIE